MRPFGSPSKVEDSLLLLLRQFAEPHLLIWPKATPQRLRVGLCGKKEHPERVALPHLPPPFGGREVREEPGIEFVQTLRCRGPFPHTVLKHNNTGHNGGSPAECLGYVTDGLIDGTCIYLERLGSGRWICEQEIPIPLAMQSARAREQVGLLELEAFTSLCKYIAKPESAD